MDSLRTDGEKMDEAEALKAFDRGHAYYKQKRPTEALYHYKKALKLFRKVGDAVGEADTLLEMGNIHFNLDNFEVALDYYNESADLYNKKNDLVGEGYALVGLGLVSDKYKEYKKSRDYYEKSLRKFQQVGDYEREGLVLSLIANTYLLSDALKNAIVYYKKSLEFFRKIGDKENEAKLISKIEECERIIFEKQRRKSTKKEIAVSVLYLFAIILGEVLTTYYSMRAGLITHSLVLFLLIIHSSLSYKNRNFSNLLTSMMILPMIRIVGLSMPIMQIKPLYWFSIISIPLFAAAFIIMRIQGIDRKKVGLVFGNIPVQLAVASTGIIFGFVEYFILKPKPLISSFSLEPLLLASALLIISTGFAEELLFRGILQRNAEKVFGMGFGLLYASLLFTSLHIGWKSHLDWIFVFGVAMFYGYSFQKTRSLFGITLSHGLSNIFLFLIVPFIF